MIKYSVTVGPTTTEFSDETFANEFASFHSASVVTVNEDTSLTYAEKRQIQDALLAASWAFITPYFDQPAFIQMTDWKSNLADDHPVKTLIAAVQIWKDAVMMEYLMRKKPYMWAGYPYDYDYSFIGAPPCSFTDMFLSVNPQFAPGGYTPGTR